MEILVSDFEQLQELQPFLPSRQSPHPVHKSQVVPMEILFKDEKFSLSQLLKDAALTGDSQVGYG